MIASECGMPQYREKYAQVSTLIDLWERNVPAVVCAASDPEVRLCVCVCVHACRCVCMCVYVCMRAYVCV